MIDESATKPLFGFDSPTATVRGYQCTFFVWMKLIVPIAINKCKTLRSPRQR